MAGDGEDRAEIGRLRRLVDWPWVVVEVECSLCRRAGRYRLARLAERHGPEMALGALLLALVGRCGLNKPGFKPRQYEAQCGARYRVPAGGPLPAGAAAREARLGEGWPPRPRRLGPEGPLPTIAAIRAQGVTAVRICCEASLARGVCLHIGEVALDILGLPDDAVFIHIPRLRRFRCLRCGSAKVRAVPSWPDVRGKREEEVTPRMPGTLHGYRMPGLGEAPTGQ